MNWEDLPINKMMETEAYQQKKMALFRAINTDLSKGGDVSLYFLDREEFKHSDEEKALLRKLKNEWRETMKLKYGPSWTKRGASHSFGMFGNRMN